MMDGLLENLDQSLDIRVEYMDAKNLYKEEDLKLFSDMMDYKYTDHAFDAIISTDDYAFQYALSKQETLFKNVPIFFSGINSKEGYNFDALENVYGIFEKASIQETIDVAQNLNPKIRNIHFIIDDSISGNKTKLEVLDVLDSHFEIITYDQLTLDEITHELKHINSEESIILLGYYIVDPSGVFHDTNVMTKRITQVSRVPVYGLYNFSMDYGIVGGKLISAYEQGQRLTEIMTNYFLGLYKKQYIETNESNIYKYDYNELVKYNLDYKKLPEEAFVFNVPQPFYKRHQEVLIGSFIIVFILSLYILLLRKQVRFHTKKNVLFNNKLNESDKLASLGEMIYRISHELNTPLGNSITNATYIEKLNSDVLEHFNEGKLSKTMLLEKLTQIGHSAELLNKSLGSANELMTAFRVFSEHNAHDKITTFDLKYYLQNLIRTYNPLLISHHNKILLYADDNLVIIGETKNYYKIFNHLIRNSIEHGFENLEYKEIHIQVIRTKKNLLIKYTDNGHGIKKKDADHIFKHLYSTKNETHVGLGLSEVKQIVTEMDGSIKLYTDLSEGISVDIVLPIKND